MAYAIFAGNTVAGTARKDSNAAVPNGDSRAVLHALHSFYLSLFSLRVDFGIACPHVLCVAFRAVRAVFRA